MNALLELQKHNQSIWLDYIRRDLIVGGGLKQLVTQDGLSGVTSNPTLFEHTIDGGGQYDDALRELFARRPTAEPGEILRRTCGGRRQKTPQMFRFTRPAEAPMVS